MSGRKGGSPAPPGLHTVTFDGSMFDAAGPASRPMGGACSLTGSRGTPRGSLHAQASRSSWGTPPPQPARQPPRQRLPAMPARSSSISRPVRPRREPSSQLLDKGQAEASFINKLRSHYTSSGSAHGFSIKASPGHEIRGDSPAPGGPPAAAPATLEEQEWAVWEQREGELAESQGRRFAQLEGALASREAKREAYLVHRLEASAAEKIRDHRLRQEAAARERQLAVQHAQHLPSLRQAHAATLAPARAQSLRELAGRPVFPASAALAAAASQAAASTGSLSGISTLQAGLESKHAFSASGALSGGSSRGQQGLPLLGAGRPGWQERKQAKAAVLVEQAYAQVQAAKAAPGGRLLSPLDAARQAARVRALGAAAAEEPSPPASDLLAGLSWDQIPAGQGISGTAEQALEDAAATQPSEAAELSPGMLASGRSLDSGADKGDAAAVAGWTEGLPAGLDAYSGEEEAQQADRAAASTSKAEAEEDEQEQEQAARQADHKPRQSLDAAAETEAVTAVEEEGEASAGEEGAAADDEDSWLEDEEPPQYLPLTTAPPEPQSAPAPAVLLMTEPADEGRAAAAEEGVHAELKGWVTDEAVSDTGAPLFAGPPAEAELAVAAHKAAMAERPATSDSMHLPLQEAWQEDPGDAQADRAVDDSGDASPAALQAAPMQDSNAGLAAEGVGVLPVGSGDTAASGPENSPVAKLPCTESGDTPVAAVDCVPAAEAAEEVAAQQKAAAGIEAGMEAVTEASMEAGSEVGTEAGMEAGIEAGIEAGSEAGMEASTEAGTEAGIEAGSEAATEAGMEASMEAGMDPALVKAAEQQQEEEEAPVGGEQHAVEDAQLAQQEQQPAAEQQGKVVVPAAAAQEFAPAPDVEEQEDKEGRYEPQAEAEEVAADIAEDPSPDPSVEAVCAADTAGALLLSKVLTAQEKQSLEEQEKEAQGQEQPLEEQEEEQPLEERQEEQQEEAQGQEQPLEEQEDEQPLEEQQEEQQEEAQGQEQPLERQEEEALAAEQIQQGEPMARQQEEQEAQEQAVEQPIEGESRAEESSVPALPLETQQQEAAEVLALLCSSSCGNVAASPPAIDTLLEPAAAVVAAASPAISPSLTECAAQLSQRDEMVATAAEGEAGQQLELPLLLQAPAADSSAPASPHDPPEAAMAVLASAPPDAPQQAAEEEHGMPPPQPQPQPQPADEEAAQLTGSPPVHPAPAADRMVDGELMRDSTAAKEEEQEEEEEEGEEGAGVEGAAVALVQGSLLESAAESLRLLLSPDAAPVAGAGPVTIDSKTPSEAAPPGSISADKVPEGAKTLAAADPAEIETDGGSIAAGDEGEGGQGLSTPAEAAALGSASGSQLEAALRAPASPILVSGGGGVEAVQLQLEGSGPVKGTAGNATFAQLEPSAHTVDLAASEAAAAVVEQEAVAQEVEAEEEEAKEAVKQAGEACSSEDAPAVVVEIEPVEEATSADESESGSDAGWPLGSEGSGDSDQQENASGLVTAVELFADLAGSPPALAALSLVPHPEASVSDDSSAAHESSVVSEALPSASGSQQQQAAGQLVTAMDLCADLPAYGPERAEAEQTVIAAEGNTTIQQLFLAAPGSGTAKD
ncbi:hypothetical protein D9Q98_007132 [Chlorella vulgaris]|uniref:Uncharacterized protein n=1 Tax=Chlorella vulgaris TaxID=3077 RepID=A0A9D4TJK6_CHLVU|nr:hypothetical protein D9Q98_007132 [Chlorella vulgaris]